MPERLLQAWTTPGLGLLLAKKSHQNGPHGAPVGRCERSTARRATHPRTASQAGDALVGQTSGFVDHHEKERYDKLILMTC